MALIGGEGLYGFGESCPIHGEEAAKECRVCGAEYCGVCHPNGRCCPDCIEDSRPGRPFSEPDFDDVDNLDRLLRDNGLAGPRRARRGASKEKDLLPEEDGLH